MKTRLVKFQRPSPFEVPAWINPAHVTCIEPDPQPCHGPDHTKISLCGYGVTVAEELEEVGRRLGLDLDGLGGNSVTIGRDEYSGLLDDRKRLQELARLFTPTNIAGTDKLCDSPHVATMGYRGERM